VPLFTTSRNGFSSADVVDVKYLFSYSTARPLAVPPELELEVVPELEVVLELELELEVPELVVPELVLLDVVVPDPELALLDVVVVPDAVPEVVVVAPELPLVLEVPDAEELDVLVVEPEPVVVPEPLLALAPELVAAPELVPPGSWHRFDAGSQTRGTLHVMFPKQAQ
jgi:hypothetical protein